jgi:hypothetical protein
MGQEINSPAPYLFTEVLIMAGMYGVTKGHVFHNSAVQAGQGNAFIVESYKTIAVDIDGAITSATIAFKYTGENGVQKSLKGMRVSDWAMGTGATLANPAAETWTFDVTGLHSVIIDIEEITPGSGSLTITGMGVA